MFEGLQAGVAVDGTAMGRGGEVLPPGRGVCSPRSSTWVKAVPSAWCRLFGRVLRSSER